MSVYTTSTNGIFLGWEKTENIGTLSPGEKSDLGVKLFVSTSTVYVNYYLTNGSLPNGLELKHDGSIVGEPLTNIGISNSITTSTFSITAKDNNNNVLSTGTFNITITQTTSTEYTNLYFKPLQTIKKRKELYNFLHDTSIFEPDLIYRPHDLNFGVQNELKLVIDFGVEISSLENYANIVLTNFQKRRFELGSLKYANTLDIYNNVKYYIIYLDVMDKNQNKLNESVTKEFIYNNKTYYPCSIKNMKARIKQYIGTSDKLNPKFTKEKQMITNTTLGYIPFVPLCFTTPDGISKIYKNIKDSNFKFRNIDFDIDRIYIEKTSTNDTKYLILNRTTGMM